jgi:peptidoglycan/xylan/chitin deacetylase (PgdA/CDA1 family)
VLTFDDGPHAATAEIAAILKQYGAPAVFFSVGSNLGTVAATARPSWAPRADVSRKLLKAPVMCWPTTA